MQHKVVVTGIGIISAIGFDTKSVMDSLQAQRSGIGRLSLIDSVYKDEIPVAEIKATNDELLQIAEPGITGNYSRTCLLGIIAARQAIRSAGIELSASGRTGLISATTVGGMDRSEIYYRAYLSGSAKARLRDVVTHDCGDSTEKIADCTGIRDYITTINTACSSSANAIMVGARLIREGKLDRVVAGGTDALTLFTLNGFNSLMILDRNPCRPFDEDRNGLNLGEGSGFLVLESEEFANRENKKVLGVVTGYGNACDAYHQTASSPEGHGACLSMTKALEVAGLAPDAISYINAHGTGTKNNDLSEGVALETVFPAGIPPCSSTKAYTGHTLGAAGGIEAVLSIIALQRQWIYPNLNFTRPMHELNFVPVTAFGTGVPINCIMSNSFGFGGNNSTLIFSRY